MLGVRNPLNFPSCVYVWVMNHLRIVFGDAFGLFWGFFCWIYGKRDEISKSGQFRGPTPQRRDPMQRRGREGGLDKPRVRRGIEKLRHSVATVHSMKIFVFCFVLFFHYSEDLSIGLMKTL